jgi:hypothetical protein
MYAVFNEISTGTYTIAASKFFKTPYYYNNQNHQSTPPYFCRMELTFNTPALLFPAISLLLLAYTNRFVALASLVRNLHKEYKEGGDAKVLVQQIRNLRRRINFIRYMQGLGVFSFLLCVACMYCIYNGWLNGAHYVFAMSLLSLLASLIFSLIEIIASTNALELELSDIEGIEHGNIFSDIWNKKS